jgi:hypothetical protein
VDYATEIAPARWYSGQDKVGYFQHYSKNKIDSLLRSGDTLTVGVGQLAINTCNQFTMDYIGKDIYNRYMRNLYTGDVIKLKLWRQNNKLYHSYLGVL